MHETVDPLRVTVEACPASVREVLNHDTVVRGVVGDKSKDLGEEPRSFMSGSSEQRTGLNPIHDAKFLEYKLHDLAKVLARVPLGERRS